VPRDSTRQPGKQEEEEEEEEEETVLALCHVFPVLVSSSFVLMLFSPDPVIFSAFKPKFSNALSSTIAVLANLLNLRREEQEPHPQNS